MKALLSLTLAALLSFPAIVAAQSPKETVETMASKLKESGNPAAIVEFVHWPSAFETLDAQQRQIRNINSPEQLRNQYLELFNNPKAIFREQMDRMKAQMPPEQQQAVEAQMAQAETMLQNMMTEMKAKLAKTEFSVGEVADQGDSATVELITTSDGKSETNKLKMIKVDDKWYLATLDSLDGQAAGPGAPTAGVPAP